LRGKDTKETEEKGAFALRVKLGDYEVEIKGKREEVLKTVSELPGLTANLASAFNNLKPKTVATITVKKEPAKETVEASVQKYPKIVETEKCDEAVLRVLETDWGKWRPRTITEIREALRANEISFAGRVLAGVLVGLAKKGKVRSWKTPAGYVYILAEEEA
jgi:hypothetical protein